jgi:DNA-binding transcriptional MerR regulator
MPKQAETKDLTIKEAANELDISESTIKRHLKDFDLPSSGSGNKATISQDTFQALQEIAKLRANGLTIQEIKELKSQEPSKTILDEIEETASSKEEVKVKEDEKIENKEKVTEEPEVEIKDDIENEITESEEAEPTEETTGNTIRKIIQGEQREQAPRRRGFNYRYVERQVSVDSKKVSSLRQRLRSTNLSVQDKLFFEESLERRILFLNGWKHILRWIAK